MNFFHLKLKIFFIFIFICLFLINFPLDYYQNHIITFAPRVQPLLQLNNFHSIFPLEVRWNFGLSIFHYFIHSILYYKYSHTLKYK